MTYRRLVFAPVRRAGLVLAAGLALSLAGCDRDNATAQAIEKATIDLHSLAPGGTNAPIRQVKDARYKGIISGLQGAGAQGTKSQGAAASLLIAQAQAGLAEAPAADAADLERLGLAEVTELRGLLGRWLACSGLAAVNAAFDPSVELADIAKQVKDREEERVDQQRQKAAIDQQVAGFQQQAKERSDAAKAKRQEAGALRSQVPTQTAVQGEQTLKQAQEISRAADALEVEAADLEAQAARIAPQSSEIQLQIDRISSQLQLSDKAKADVMKRAGAAKANADSAQAEAATVAAEISKRQGELEKMRADRLGAAADEAITQYRAAAKSADSARGEARTTALMAHGSAQQSLGDMLWSRAQGLTAYADMLEALATATPALPEAGAYKTKADEARAAAKLALEQATEAYKAANESYQTGGGTGNQERLDRINQKLAAAVKVTSGGSEDIRNPEAPKEETPGEAPAATGAATTDANSPQATIKALFDLSVSGDLESGVDLFYTATDEEKQAVRSLLAIGTKAQKFQDALKSKFGAEAEAAMSQMAAQAAPGGFDPSKFKDLNAEDVQVKVTGDTAEGTLPGGGPALKLRQKDGRWLIDLGLPPEQLAATQAMLAPMGKAMDEMTADVKAGKFKTVQEAMAVFMQKMMAGAMQNMPKAPGKK